MMRYLIAFLLFTAPALAQYPINLTPTTPVVTAVNNFAPAGTTSGVAVMMGMGSLCTITPKSTGTVQFTFVGNVNNSIISDGWLFSGAEGTGTAPVNGAATTGTSFGTAQQGVAFTAGGQIPFALSGVVTGLTVGVPVWFDMRLNAITAGTALLQSVTCIANELH
jgi:hypothetical protein